MTPTQARAEAERIVDRAIRDIGAGSNDPANAAYMIARAALLRLGNYRGTDGAAEAAYRLGDEIVGLVGSR